MKIFDCFNGDADGLCALTQIRLHTPLKAQLVTGVKRDITLLAKVKPSAQDQITVLDVSLDKNRQDLERVLDLQAHVFYCDHHFAGEIPQRDNLTTLINTSANVCTSLLINQKLDSQYLAWAVVGTFGDNLDKSAYALAKPLKQTSQEIETLRKLGIYLNYNGYGLTLDDLHFHPAELFSRMVLFEDPHQFICEDNEAFLTLESGYHDDMHAGNQAETIYQNTHCKVIMLPNEAWARRVSGVLANQLANKNPDCAHAIVTQQAGESFLVSVRAPLNNKQGADEICRQFDTGGGRAAAAGITHLQQIELPRFIDCLSAYYH